MFSPLAIAVVSAGMYGHYSIAEWLVKMVRHILFYPYGSLWYVYALILAFLLLIPAIKSNKIGYAVTIGFGLYCIFLLFNRYNFLVADTWLQIYIKAILNQVISLRNGIFVGLLFVGLGIMISKQQSLVMRHKKKLLFFTVGAAILLFMEVYMIRNKAGIDDNSFYLTYPLFIPLLFCCTISSSSIPFNTVVVRNLSTSIYFMQKPLLGICALCGLGGLDRFVTVLVTIALICLLIYPKKIQPLYDWLR